MSDPITTRKVWGVSLQHGTIKSFDLEREEAHTIYYVHEGVSYRRAKRSTEYHFYTDRLKAYQFLSAHLQSQASEYEALRQMTLQKKTSVDEHLDSLVTAKEESEAESSSPSLYSHSQSSTDALSHDTSTD